MVIGGGGLGAVIAVKTDVNGVVTGVTPNPVVRGTGYANTNGAATATAGGCGCTVNITAPGGAPPAGGITAVALGLGGGGYPSNQVINLVVTGGGGTGGVVAASTDGNGVVTGVALVSGGAGYITTAGVGTATARFNWVQTLNSQSLLTMLNGSRRFLSTNGQTALDTDYPYLPFPINQGTPQQAGCYGTFTQSNPIFSDTPSESLNLTTMLSRATTDQFSTYVMFMPPGNTSRYVPLTRQDWTYNYTLLNSGSGCTVDFQVQGGGAIKNGTVMFKTGGNGYPKSSTFNLSRRPALREVEVPTVSSA